MTLVVQDWGGPIGFRFAVEHPERVARLVVLNTGIGARAPNEEWLRFQAFMRRVGTEIVAGQLVRLSLVQPVERRGDRRLRRAVPGAGVTRRDRPVPGARRDERRTIRPRPRCSTCASGCARFDRPALVLFSDSDPIFSRRAAEVMAELLPNAELDPPLEGAGHFLQEDRGERRRADRRLAPLTGFIPRRDAFPYAAPGTSEATARATHKRRFPTNAALGGPESL